MGVNGRIGFARLAYLVVGAGLASASLTTTPAEARHHHHGLRSFRAPRAQTGSAPAEVDASKFSAIVMDANTGRELWGVNENALRHPASITKVMTLYLLFEALERGDIALDSRIPVSEHAAGQEPSKLGVPAGETIGVEDAIKAITTRSANDMAVAVAEALGHDESSFAAMMTHKAHQLGMSRTLYRNASGLPNDEQLTTARDLSRLGTALQERFPKYFHYFSLHEFVYDGETIGNHDHLLGKVDGVDGIKTGYTRASGFNLLTSVHLDGRALVAVVMGGRSAAARDRLMARLIDTHMADASPVHSATRLADNSADDAASSPVRAQPDAARPPVAVAQTQASADADPQGEGDVSDDDAQADAPIHAKAHVTAASSRTDRHGKKAVAARKAESGETRVARAESAPHNGWFIQIGTGEDADRVRNLLARARRHDPHLAASRGLTQKYASGDGALYRARFVGMSSAEAAQACRRLRHGGVSCFAAQVES